MMIYNGISGKKAYSTLMRPSRKIVPFFRSTKLGRFIRGGTIFRIERKFTSLLLFRREREREGERERERGGAKE